MKKYSIKMWIDRFLIILMILLIVSALVSSLYMFQQTRVMERTVMQTYELNGELYTCKFYKGEMQECWLVDDPDVGGGKAGE